MTTIADRLTAWYARFIITSQPEDIDTLALWTLHTWTIDQGRTTPRLIITAPVPASGKTTVLDHLERLARNPEMMANAPTKSLAARVANGSTLLLDETDKWGGGEDVRAVYGIVNAGYRRGGSYKVLEPNAKTGRHEPTDFPVFGAVAFAGISPDLPDDTLSRSITVRLLPDVDDQAEESDWEYIEGEAEELRREIEAWAATVELVGGENLGPGITGRMREVWRPLQRVADQLGAQWSNRCRALAQRHRADLEALAEDGMRMERPHVALVRDLYSIWPGEDDGTGDRRHVEFVRTDELVQSLHTHYPAMWGVGQATRPGGLTRQGMGQMLAKHWGVTTDRPRVNGDRARGYYERRFHSAWRTVGVLDEQPDRWRPRPISAKRGDREA